MGVFSNDCNEMKTSSHYTDSEQLTRPRGYKTFFMLSSAETNIYPAHKC